MSRSFNKPFSDIVTVFVANVFRGTREQHSAEPVPAVGGFVMNNENSFPTGDRFSFGQFQVGDIVRIRSGTFEGFEAVVVEIEPVLEKAVVEIEIFGRGTPVELLFTEIEKV